MREAVIDELRHLMVVRPVLIQILSTCSQLTFLVYDGMYYQINN